MYRTIFYSWQNDTPNKTNRNFIEDCLEKAIREIKIDLAVDEPERNDSDIKLEKDTKGVSGSPPIADTIFKKIDQCEIFVPDLTFVGVRSDGKRKMPNTNVIVEYGYAVNALGHERIIAVMNTAYGPPRDAEGHSLMPFHMQHLRDPITYKLNEDDEPDVRTDVKNRLISILKSALNDALRSQLKRNEAPPIAHEPIPTGFQKSTFLQKGEKLLTYTDRYSTVDNNDIFMPEGPQMFLRMLPNEKQEEWTPYKLQQLAENVLRPFGPLLGYSWDINERGAVIFTGGFEGKTANQIVQVFLNGEIWGINGQCFGLLENGKKEPILLPEEMYENTLCLYRSFLHDKLNISPPFKFIAGMVGTIGRGIVLPKPPPGKIYYETVVGNCVSNEIIHEDQVEVNASAHDALLPFYDKVYEFCGIPRPK